MFNPIKIFRRSIQQPAPEQAPAELVWVHENYILEDVDQMTVRQILDTLRRDTIEFTEKHNLTWGATDITVRGLPVRVKITEDQDVVYSVNFINTFNIRDAITLIKTEAVTF
jgi:hypothetical protein